jgi:hypothetical protein
MQLPLQIIQVGDQRVNRREQTRDISSGGICFLSSTAVEVGDRIEYLITLSGSNPPRSNPPVRIRCLGKVMRRREPRTSDEGNYEIAVTMERYQFVRADELDGVLASF